MTIDLQRFTGAPPVNTFPLAHAMNLTTGWIYCKGRQDKWIGRFTLRERGAAEGMKQHNLRFLAVVDDAKRRVVETDVETVRSRMDAGDRFHLIDVREESEWVLGHLPGAKHLGKGIIERDIENVVPEITDEIILYCGGGYRSALAADALQAMGYTRVASMDGGFSGWKGAGHPVVTD